MGGVFDLPLDGVSETGFCGSILWAKSGWY